MKCTPRPRKCVFWRCTQIHYSQLTDVLNGYKLFTGLLVETRGVHQDSGKQKTHNQYDYCNVF